MDERKSPMPLYIQEAERLGHRGIGCEHLFLGILADPDGIAAKVLASHGVSLDLARSRTDEMVGDGWKDSVRWSHSPRATTVRRLAAVEAERLGGLEPGNAHLLLALITEGGGIPMRILSEVGVNVCKLREELVNSLDVPDAEREMYLRQRNAYEAHAAVVRRAELG
ncbi:MAG: Clp protease N-terminal domain-containing protein [Solirubrobacteraceae bacterium]